MPHAQSTLNGSHGNGVHALNGTATSKQGPSPAWAKIDAAASFIRSRCSLQPEFLIVLGSGLGGIADDVVEPTIIPYADIPGFFAPTVQGHAGRVVMGQLSGVPVMVLQGRFHFYEGHSMDEVVLPTRVAWALGARAAFLTNAAGGINASFAVGDVMVITDHLNMMGVNPLRGPNPPELRGARFVDMSEPYDRTFAALLAQLGGELALRTVRTGTFAAVSGPTYETPAETRMLRLLGADAVAMSTVPEAIAARHLGMRVVAMSCITNVACGADGGGAAAAAAVEGATNGGGKANEVTHEEVMENIGLGAEKVRKLLAAALPTMAASLRGMQQ